MRLSTLAYYHDSGAPVNPNIFLSRTAGLLLPLAWPFAVSSQRRRFRESKRALRFAKTQETDSEIKKKPNPAAFSSFPCFHNQTGLLNFRSLAPLIDTALILIDGFIRTFCFYDDFDDLFLVASPFLLLRLSFSEPDALQVLLIVENIPNHEQSLGREADEEDVPGMGVD